MSRTSDSPIILRAGPLAINHIRQYGLQASDIAVIPAAAGGPKGLILKALDQWLFGEWLKNAPRHRSLIGASVGAWRMAAANMADPVRGFARLSELYCHQSYPSNPGKTYVTDAIVDFVNEFITGHEQEIVHHQTNHLHILTTKGLGLLQAPKSDINTTTGFAAAIIANMGARSRLAKHMGRVIIGDQSDPLHWLNPLFDAFSTEYAALSIDNLKAALLASGTLPFIMDPVRHIPNAPQGTYWDGGLIDYHLNLPYTRLNANNTASTQLVLFPHYSNNIVPGWLDKSLIWRRANKGKNSHWLDNMIMVSPSTEFIKSLPREQLPNRKDFAFHGANNQRRIQEWQRAIATSAQLRDAFAAFTEKPDVRLIQPF